MATAIRSSSTHCAKGAMRDNDSRLQAKNTVPRWQRRSLQILWLHRTRRRDLLRQQVRRSEERLLWRQTCTDRDQAESLDVHWRFHGKAEGRKFGSPPITRLCATETGTRISRFLSATVNAKLRRTRSSSRTLKSTGQPEVEPSDVTSPRMRCVTEEKVTSAEHVVVHHSTRRRVSAGEIQVD